ncbi:protein-disulfide reductase DsbD [Sansalvadorimonas verongulae]|uniref:protein-disulfide reductase DsbD n=1 Tax=Sansalvadorimonas verongulae TaxID=2172824 RepID=UPI0012BCF622|nr:protein-disulfide reductase DsbD [Sansalvadorimonas verongulae]MTI14144.1 protein-disulfide reductase DsbD [Sansalvadorimonas verongulae]
MSPEPMHPEQHSLSILNAMPKISRASLFSLCLILMLGFSSVVSAVSFKSLLGGSSSSDEYTDSDFLPVEKAFQVSGEIGNGELIIHFAVTPEHYLYRHMFGFSAVKAEATQLGEPAFPAGKIKFDPFMKQDVEIYPEDLSVHIPITTSEEFPEIRITFQGCADAGLCYPPTTQNIIPLQTSGAPQVQPQPLTTQEDIEDNFLSALLGNSSLISILGLFFVGGLALTFTPCVLPMIPIVSAMVANSNGSRSHNILLTACYVLAMSATYAIAGMLMGYFGASLNLQARLQSPWLLIPFAILFVALALSMFGLYELQLPEKLRSLLTQADQKSQEKRKGTWIGASLAGVFSTLLVSPCVSAPLAGALVYISGTGDMVIGGLSLFALGLGMGTPLFIVGAGGASLLPKAGMWMNGIKAVFGVLMLGVAIWMIERLIPEPVTLLLWGTLLVGCAVYLGALDFNKRTGWQAFRQVVGILSLIYGATLFVGGIQGNTNPLQPLDSASQSHAVLKEHPVITVSTSEDMNRVLAQASAANSPVIVDFYADWCISCKIFERDVLPQPEVQAALEGYTFLRIDLTENSADQRGILQQYQLFGPPAFLFFNKAGEELDVLRKQGEIDAKTFTSLLNRANIS